MITDAIKKYRDVFSFALLAVAALYVLCGLSLLFKSQDDTGGAGFTVRAATWGYLFSHPVMVISLVAATAIAAGFAEASKQVRVIVLAALGIGGLGLFFGLISWLSSFGADEGQAFAFGGILGAGKIVGFFVGLAQLGLLAIGLLFVVTCFLALPKPVPVQHPAQSWGQQGYDPNAWNQQGYAQQQTQQGWGQQAPQQQGWGQPQTQQGWGQPAPDQQSQQGWSQPGQPANPRTWDQQTPQQQSGWGDPQPPAQPEQPVQQSWMDQQGWGQQEQTNVTDAERDASSSDSTDSGPNDAQSDRDETRDSPGS